MDPATLATGAALLSAVDLAAIGGVYMTLNKRLQVLEKGGVTLAGNSGQASAPGGILAPPKNEPVEERVISLENEIEVLLQRLQMYDDLFMKVMMRIREMSTAAATPPLNTIVEEIPTHGIKRASIKRRAEALIGRRVAFVDEGESGGDPQGNPQGDLRSDPPTTDSSDDEEMFSFLKTSPA